MYKRLRKRFINRLPKYDIAEFVKTDKNGVRYLLLCNVKVSCQSSLGDTELDRDI